MQQNTFQLQSGLPNASAKSQRFSYAISQPISRYYSPISRYQSPLGTFWAIPHDFWYCRLPNALVETGKMQEFFDKFEAGPRTLNQIASLPPVVALNRSSKSQIAARYAAFWHAVSPNRIGLFPSASLNRSVLNRGVFKTPTELNRKR